MSGCRDVANEVRSARAGAERAHASAVGGRRSRSGRPRRHRHGRARDQHVTHAYRPRHRGAQIRRSIGTRPYAARRRRSQAGRGHRPDAGLGLERVAGAHHRRGARRQSPALDLQEREQAPPSCRRWGTRWVVASSTSCCSTSATRCRRIARAPKEPSTRDAQFNYLNEQVRGAQEQGHPVISVDTKKKELIGEFKNGGREWRAKGDPEQVKVQDFVVPEQGKAIPRRRLRPEPRLKAGSVWGSIMTRLTSPMNAIRRWWIQMGVAPTVVRATS